MGRTKKILKLIKEKELLIKSLEDAGEWIQQAEIAAEPGWEGFCFV